MKKPEDQSRFSMGWQNYTEYVRFEKTIHREVLKTLH